MNDPFLQGGFKKANPFFVFLLSISFLAEILDSTQCNCVDLMNRSMHNFISRNASISHFTKKKKKRKLETRDSGYRVLSSWKSV